MNESITLLNILIGAFAVISTVLHSDEFAGGFVRCVSFNGVSIDFGIYIYGVLICCSFKHEKPRKYWSRLV